MNENTLLSYSRAYLFMNNKKEFINKYVFGMTKEETASQKKLKKMHTLVQELTPINALSSIDENKYIVFDSDDYANPNTKKRREGEAEGRIFIDEKEFQFLQQFRFHIHFMDAFKGIKQIFLSKEMEVEKEICNDNLKGIIDIYTPDACVELKGQDLDSFSRMKFRYSMQEVFYRDLTGHSNFNFLIFQTTPPYDIKQVVIDEYYIEAVSDLVFKKILPNYQSYIGHLQVFDEKIFDKDFERKNTHKYRKDFYNYVSECNLIDNFVTVYPEPWEINKVLTMQLKDFSKK